MRERYLPSAFDDQISMLDKINKVIGNMETLQAQTAVSINAINEMYQEMYDEIIPQEVEKYVMEIIGVSSQEVPNSRVNGVTNVTYATLKERLDTDYLNLSNSIASVNDSVSLLDGRTSQLESSILTKADLTSIESFDQRITEAQDLGISNEARITTLENGGSGGTTPTDDLENRVQSLESATQAMSDGINANTLNIQTLETDKAEQTVVDDISSRLQTLEVATPSMSSQITSLQTSVTNLDIAKADKTQVNSLSATVSNLATTSATKAELTTEKNRITALETNSATKTELNTEKTKITNLQTATADSGWINLTLNEGVVMYGSTATQPQYRKIGSVVNLIGAIKFNTLPNPSGTDTPIATIPTGFRPTKTVTTVQAGSGGSYSIWNVGTNGSVVLVAYTNPSVTTSSWFPFTITWMV